MKYNSSTLREIRKGKNFTQGEFAEAIGITRELYTKMENGKLAISKSTEVLLDNYLKGESEKNPKQKDNDSIIMSQKDTIDAQRETIELQKSQIAALRDEIERLRVKEPLRPGKGSGVSTKKNVEDA